MVIALEMFLKQKSTAFKSSAFLNKQVKISYRFGQYGYFIFKHFNNAAFYIESV